MYLKGKNEKGITLVALVVTIVVLIILAVISINAVFGEDGIIKRAEEARDAHLRGEQDEQDALESLDSQISELIGGEKTPEGPVNPTPGVLVTGQNADYTDESGTAKIPVGFCVVKDVGEDKNTIANGLVISDVAEDDLDNSKKGNQFVWIPVAEADYEEKFHLIEGYSNGKLQTYLSLESNPSREAGASKTEIIPGKPNEGNTVLGTDESVAMYNSVKINHGFYIARFEAGISKTKADGTIVDNYSLASEDRVAATGAVKPLSQKGVGVWNSIPWGSSYTTKGSDGLPGDDRVDGAVKVARSMYPNTNKLEEYGLPTTLTNETGAISTLCYGVQWDAVMNFIEPNYYKQEGNLTSFVANSSENGTDKGNYTGSIKTTGSSSDYEVKHIFDLAGNVYEWTMEAYSTNSRVRRGGNYNFSASDSPASVRDYYIPNYSYVSFGFRPALYL